MKEFDEAWQEEDRETLYDLGLRISLFLQLLVGRSETHVVVYRSTCRLISLQTVS